MTYRLFVLVGTHIKIKKPQNEPDLYYNRKQQFSINVLVVADESLQFRYYFLGAFGSAHDSRVYRCSKLPELLSNSHTDLVILGEIKYFPPELYETIMHFMLYCRRLSLSADKELNDALSSSINTC